MKHRGSGQAEHAALARHLHVSLVRMCSEESRCALLIVRPLAATAETSGKDAAPGTWDLPVLARQLRALVRDTDEIHVDGERGIAILLRGAGIRGGHIVIGRLAESLDESSLPRSSARAQQQIQSAPWKLAIGVSEVTRLDLAAPEHLAKVIARA